METTRRASLPVAGTRAATAVAGLGWLAQSDMPFTSMGPLASSTPLDAARLALSGVLPTTIPYWSAFALVSLPACGLILLACASMSGDASTAMRLVVTVLGVITTIALIVVLADSSFGRLGLGGWTTVASTTLAALTLPSQLLPGSRNAQ